MTTGEPVAADAPGSGEAPADGTGGEDTLELELPPELQVLAEQQERAREPRPQPVPAAPTAPPAPWAAAPDPAADLLDSVAQWPAVRTSAGVLQLVPVRLERDLPLLTAWMNDPAVAAYWELAGDDRRTHDHLHAQLTGDGRSVPCLGVLDGVPMSYWEIYRADLDPLARSYPVRPHDTGLHLLLGPPESRGRGVGTVLLRAVAALVLDRRPRCLRVLAEPDVTNTASLAAFLGAGFRLAAEAELPGKRAAVMVHDRVLRELL